MLIITEKWHVVDIYNLPKLQVIFTILFVQSVTELHDGSALFITVAKYLSPALHDITELQVNMYDEIAIPLAERSARGDLTGEVCHWADGYHLNVRLYEKLLLSVFDVLDEGKLTEVSMPLLLLNL